MKVLVLAHQGLALADRVDTHASAECLLRPIIFGEKLNCSDRLLDPDLWVPLALSGFLAARYEEEVDILGSPRIHLALNDISPQVILHICRGLIMRMHLDLIQCQKCFLIPFIERVHSLCFI
jgi:hypothetical protein